MRLDKGFTRLIIIVIAIIAIGAGIGGYFVFKNRLAEEAPPKEIPSEEKAPSPQETPNPESSAKPATSKTAPSAPAEPTKTYTNTTHGFLLRYPLNIPWFEEVFAVEKFDHLYTCQLYDKGHDSYYNIYQFTSDTSWAYDEEGDSRLAEPCSRVSISFDGYLKEYLKQFVSSNARNKKTWKIANPNGIDIRGLYWELPLHGSTPDSPQIGWSPVYYVLAEIPKARSSEGRALRFFIYTSIRSCTNTVCETGETPSDCPADCKESWDAILNSIFSSFKFGQ